MGTPDKPHQAKPTGSARVYAELRRDILRTLIAPGSALDEVGLSERFDLSRSPIREALVRLSGEGLVQILPNRSTIVTPIDLQGLPEFLDSLALLQRVTTRSAAKFRTETELQRIVAAQKAYETGAQVSLDTGDAVPMIDANHAFHMAIAEAGRNRYFAAFYRRILDEGQRMLHYHLEYQRGEPDISVEVLSRDHNEMVEAIRLQDLDRAEAAAHAHAMQFRGRFMQYLERNVSSSIRIDELVQKDE